MKKRRGTTPDPPPPPLFLSVSHAESRGAPSRVTLDLLDYGFLTPAREDRDKLFFAQQEAVETAIWLNEVAERSNAGTHLLSRLAQSQQTVSETPAQVLPRMAF